LYFSILLKVEIFFFCLILSLYSIHSFPISWNLILFFIHQSNCISFNEKVDLKNLIESITLFREPLSFEIPFTIGEKKVKFEDKIGKIIEEKFEFLAQSDEALTKAAQSLSEIQPSTSTTTTTDSENISIASTTTTSTAVVEGIVELDYDITEKEHNWEAEIVQEQEQEKEKQREKQQQTVF
jgi:hypothetical protein